MAQSKIWFFCIFLWQQFRRIPPNQLKAIVHAVVGFGCFKLSADSQELVTNAALDFLQKLADLIGTASTLFAIINALHQQPKPTIVTPVSTTIKG